MLFLGGPAPFFHSATGWAPQAQGCCVGVGGRQEPECQLRMDESQISEHAEGEDNSE